MATTCNQTTPQPAIGHVEIYIGFTKTCQYKTQRCTFKWWGGCGYKFVIKTNYKIFRAKVRGHCLGSNTSFPEIFSRIEKQCLPKLMTVLFDVLGVVWSGVGFTK
jgi:hypothetical protein